MTRVQGSKLWGIFVCSTRGYILYHDKRYRLMKHSSAFSIIRVGRDRTCQSRSQVAIIAIEYKQHTVTECSLTKRAAEDASKAVVREAQTPTPVNAGTPHKLTVTTYSHHFHYRNYCFLLLLLLLLSLLPLLLLLLLLVLLAACYVQ